MFEDVVLFPLIDLMRNTTYPKALLSIFTGQTVRSLVHALAPKANPINTFLSFDPLFRGPSYTASF